MSGNRRLAYYYRAKVIIAMRDAGHSLRVIAEHFGISAERVRQIVRRGPVPAQMALPTRAEVTADG